MNLNFYYWHIQYIPRNMHTVTALLCFVVVIHWLIFPYPSGLLHWHCGNLTIAQVPAKQPWWIWINTSCEFIMNDCITTTKQSTTRPCAYFLGYTVTLTATTPIQSMLSSSLAKQLLYIVIIWIINTQKYKLCLYIKPNLLLYDRGCTAIQRQEYIMIMYLYSSCCCFGDKLWYLQHNCVEDTIECHQDIGIF